MRFFIKHFEQGARKEVRRIMAVYNRLETAAESKYKLSEFVDKYSTYGAITRETDGISIEAVKNLAVRSTADFYLA